MGQVGSHGIAQVPVVRIGYIRIPIVGVVRNIRRITMKRIAPRVFVILPGPSVQGTNVLVGQLPVDTDGVHPRRAVQRHVGGSARRGATRDTQ